MLGSSRRRKGGIRRRRVRVPWSTCHLPAPTADVDSFLLDQVAHDRATRRRVVCCARYGAGLVTRNVAVVTGAGSGIGRVVARALLDAGWSVALAGRRAEALEETADGADAALVVPTDVADPVSVTELFATARGEWGRVDLLVNNAGTFGPVGGGRRDPDRGVAVDGRGQPDRRLPVCTGGRGDDEGTGSAGRADHQQRVDLGAHAPAGERRLHRHEARDHGADEVAVARRARRTASPAGRSTSATPPRT